MTTRVFECRARPAEPVLRWTWSPRRTPAPRSRGLGAASVTALVVVPLAGAAERPSGWLAATLVALAILTVARVAGQRVRWGWLALLVCVLGPVVPRGDFAALGPGL